MTLFAIVFGTTLTGNALWFIVTRRRNRFMRQLVAALDTKHQEHVQSFEEEDDLERARR
jgi:Flp pilus assembly protein TadB